MKNLIGKRNEELMTLTIYKGACNLLLEQFVKKYFDKDTETHWVADDVAGIVEIADYYFDMETMRMALEKNVKPKWLWEYYDWSTDEQENPSGRNLNYFLNLKKLKQL